MTLTLKELFDKGIEQNKDAILVNANAIKLLQQTMVTKKELDVGLQPIRTKVDTLYTVIVGDKELNEIGMKREHDDMYKAYGRWKWLLGLIVGGNGLQLLFWFIDFLGSNELVHKLISLISNPT